MIQIITVRSVKQQATSEKKSRQDHQFSINVLTKTMTKNQLPFFTNEN